MQQPGKVSSALWNGLDTMLQLACTLKWYHCMAMMGKECTQNIVLANTGLIRIDL